MEVGAAIIGVGGAIGAAKASTSFGFTGRHEATYDSLLSHNHQSVTRYKFSPQSSRISFHDEKEYEARLGDSREKLDQYYDSLNAYKDESWKRPMSKWKKRKESASNCSDTSSIYAESGSPPGSALERERVNDWIDEVDEASTTEPLLQETSDYAVKWSIEEIQMLVEGRYEYAEDWNAVLRDPDYNLGRHPPHELAEKWAELYAAFSEQCGNTPMGTMLPDRPFLFHPKRASSAWRPFTETEDDVLHTGSGAHGSQWAVIIQDPVFQQEVRREDELCKRWERDFFRKTFLSGDGRQIYTRYEEAWKAWSAKDIQMLVEAYYKCGRQWSAVLNTPDYQFGDRRSFDELDEKWVELCGAFNEHCTDTKIHTMLPDRPFIFHPKTVSHAWRPFTETEDNALHAGFEVHGSQWAVIIHDPIFQQAIRHETYLLPTEDELRMRWERDYFRKTLLSTEGRQIYMFYEAGWKEWSVIETQMLIEAYHKCGEDWSSILEDLASKFGERRSQLELKEKWADLSDAFSEHCRQAKRFRLINMRMPDRPFLFHPNRASSGWRPFTQTEDNALCIEVESHGAQWALIAQKSVFHQAGHHDEELLMRWKRDFFRKMLLKGERKQLYTSCEASWKEWSLEETQMLVEAYYKCGEDWSAILEDPSYNFDDSRLQLELKEKWADLCAALKRHYRDEKLFPMLPDRPFLFQPDRPHHQHTFTDAEDRAFEMGFREHGSQWKMIVQNPILQRRGRDEHQLLLRVSRDFFRRTLLSSRELEKFYTPEPETSPTLVKRGWMPSEPEQRKRPRLDEREDAEIFEADEDDFRMQVDTD